MIQWRRFFVLLFIAVFSLTFIACSDDDSGSGTSGATGSTGGTVTWHTETFDSAPSTGSTYTAGSFTSNDVNWTFYGRTDQTLNGTALLLGKTTGYLQGVFPSCGVLKFQFKDGYDNAPVKVYVDGALVHTTVSSTGTAQDSGQIAINKTSSCTIRFEADPIGQRIILDDISWTTDGSGSSDTDNPTVTISAPASGAGLTSSSVTVSGTAADPGTDPTGVKEVWVKLDSGTEVKATGTTSWSTTLSGVGDGSHTITVYAKDNAGNRSTDATVSFTVTLPPDTTAPTVAITVPASGADIVASSLAIAGTATDPGTDPSGVKAVWYKLDNTDWQQATGTTGWSASISGVSNGSRTLSVYAVDNKTNYSSTNTVSFTYTYTNTVYPYIVDGKFQPQATDPYYSYYSSAAGLSGDALRTELQSIISAGYSQQSYTPGVWNAYETTDRIPSGVNSGKIWDMYSDTGDGTGGGYYYTFATDQCGSAGGGRRLL